MPIGAATHAQHLAAALDDRLARLLLKVMPERIIGGDEVPVFLTLFDDGAAQRVAELPCVISPLHRVRAALRSRQRGRAGPRTDEGFVLVLDELTDRERDRRVRHVGDHIDAVLIDPFPDDPQPHIRLVLVIGREDLDLSPRRLSAVVLDRHLSREHRSRSLVVGVGARHVVENADPYRLLLGQSEARRPEKQARGGDGDNDACIHRDHRDFLPDCRRA